MEQHNGYEAVFVPAPDLVAGTGPGAGPDLSWLPFIGATGLVGRGLLTLLSGRPKSGKTTLLAHAARRWIADGLRVAWLSEEPRPLWRQRIARLDLAHHDLLLAFSDGSASAVWAERLRALSPAPDVIVVDTLRAFAGLVDENDAALAHRSLAPLMQVARERNAALVVLHHRRKTDGGEGEGIDHAGSHAFVGAADIAISLRETQDPRRRELITRSRLEETPARVLVELSEAGAYHMLGAPEAVAAAEVRGRVRTVLAEDPATTLSTRAIVDRLEHPRPSPEAVRRALHELAAAGVVVRLPGRGRRPDQWQLAELTDEEEGWVEVGGDNDDDLPFE